GRRPRPGQNHRPRHGHSTQQTINHSNHIMEHLFFTPMFGLSAIQFAFEKATPEGKVTICFLAIVSMLSWTVIITKGRQLWRARRAAKKFFTAYRSTRDPLDLHRKKQEFDGAPAYEVYFTGTEEMAYHLAQSPVKV